MVKVNPISNYPVQPEALYLRDLLQRTLDRTVEIFDSVGVPLPSRRYWCAGQAAEDCAQVVVVFISSSLGLPGSQQTEVLPCNSTQFATIEVKITRDLPQGPNGNPATPTQLQEASSWPVTDAYVLINNLQAYDTTALGTRGAGVLATVATAPPSGFVQTTTLTLQLAMI